MASGARELRELGGGTWQGALEILREEMGRSWARQLGAIFSHAANPRNAARGPQRWAAAAGLTNARQKVTPPVGIQERLIALAAARRLAGMSGAYVGGVDVAYGDRNEGSRNIGSVTGAMPFTGELGDARDRAVNELNAGNFDAAARELGAGFLNEYGPGLGAALEITDYHDPIGWEE